MPTTTTPRRAGTPRRPPTTTPRSRPAMPRRRKPAPPSRGEKLVGLLSSAVPSGKTAAKAKGAGKGPKGLALLGAAGGLAAVLKNRDKLTSKMGRSQSETVVPAPAVTSVPEPSPVAVRPEGTLGDNSAPGSL